MSNIVKFIILGLLLISIPLTVKLAQERQIFKPKANTSDICFESSSGNCDEPGGGYDYCRTVVGCQVASEPAFACTNKFAGGYVCARSYPTATPTPVGIGRPTATPIPGGGGGPNPTSAPVPGSGGSCIPDTYKTQCTGNKGSCAADAGEQEVWRCNADSSLGPSYGQCSTECVRCANPSLPSQPPTGSCTPDTYSTQCTTNRGSCASDAGEQEVWRCKADSTWGPSYGQCSTECARCVAGGATPTVSPTPGGGGGPNPTATPTPGGGCTSNCTFPQQDADGQVRCYKGTIQENVCKYDPCLGTQEVPCQSTKTATLTSSCPSSTATLTATWDVGTGTDCNAYIQAGTTPHVISSDCKGTKSVTGAWVVNGGTYTLHVGDPGGQTTSSTQATITCGNVTPGTSNTKLYIEPATFGTGQSMSVLATGSTSCSTGLVDVATFGAGITGCTRGGGFTCSGNPKNDGNACWYKWNCTAGPAGSYTAKFNASGSNCLSTADYTVTSTTVTAPPTASPTVPPNTRTLLFKFAETREGLDQARYQPYNQHPITIPHTFSSTPGDKWIYVRFKLSDGSERDVNPVKIKLLGPDPAFTNISCQDNPTGVGTQVTLKGTDFGDRGASSVLLNNRIAEITSWTAPSATTSAALYKVVAKTADKYNEGTSLPVKLTIDDGRSVAGTCVTSTPIVDYAIRIPCQPVGNIATLNVRVQIYEDKDSPKPLYDQSITFDQNNKPKWTAPKLEIGKSYQIVVKAPGTLAIRKPFVADEGTTVLDNITLPVGDIFPPASPDSLINTFDKAELVRQWTATNDVLRSGDFNKDSRVNSIDYSCMLTGFNAPSSQFLKGK